MFGKAKIAFSVAIALGVLGADSASLAAPVHHDRAGGTRAVQRAHENPLPWQWNYSNVGRGAFGYQPSRRAARPSGSFERSWMDYQDCPTTEGGGC
jgi:hypothetical protein